LVFDCSPDGAQTIIDPRGAAEAVGLRYVSDARPGILRRKIGKGFTYTRADGSRLTELDALRRIKALAVPPAWTDVWICPFADGHIQATGRDAKGRKQYRYHALFREVRESTKYEHLVAFAEALSLIRDQVREHMALRGLPREKVLATIVHLLETTLIRVGNDDYAKQNNSYGLTTLKNRHVAVDGNEVRFRFTGKSGKQWSLRVRDRRIAKIVRACQELPGQELLQYVDEEGNCQDVTSTDVNAYLKEIAGRDITAKDFRTWAGTVLAAMALSELEGFDSAAQAKRNLRAAIEKVSARLGNTSTICRKCYVHPEVLNSYLDGKLALELKSKAEDVLRSSLGSLTTEEAAVLALLRSRLATEATRCDGQRVPRLNNGTAKQLGCCSRSCLQGIGSVPAENLAGRTAPCSPRELTARPAPRARGDSQRLCNGATFLLILQSGPAARAWEFRASWFLRFRSRDLRKVNVQLTAMSEHWPKQTERCWV
jgi:DNA topoisomerase I